MSNRAGTSALMYILGRTALTRRTAPVPANFPLKGRSYVLELNLKGTAGLEMQKVASLPMLVRQHAEDAAFLFEQRRRAFRAHSWNDENLGRCDQRLSAHLAGLIAAGRTGSETALGGVEAVGGAGEHFVFCALAFAKNADVDLAIAKGLETPDGSRGLSGALAWSDAAVVGPLARKWLSSAEASLRHLGLVALSHHRRHPGDGLASFLTDPDPAVRSRGARLVFETGRVDRVSLLHDLAKDMRGDLWPLMALARCGQGGSALFDYAADPGRPKAELALDFALLSGPAKAREHLAAMMKRQEARSLAISRAGVLSDNSIVPWLLQRMRDADDAEAAAFAFLDMYALDPEDCGLFTADPDSLGDPFKGRDPGTYPVAERVEAWLKAAREAPAHLSLRRQMLDALRTGIANPKAPLRNWRTRRPFPAWL